MFIAGKGRERLVCMIVFITLVVGALAPAPLWASAQTVHDLVWVVRTLDTSEYGVSEPAGLAYSHRDSSFLLWRADGKVVRLSQDGDATGTFVLDAPLGAALNTAFDDSTGSLVTLDPNVGLIPIRLDAKGMSASTPEAGARFTIPSPGLKLPRGISFDPESGRLFVLEAGTGQISVVPSGGAPGLGATAVIQSSSIQNIPLPELGTGQLEGIAFNPQNGHLVIANPSKNELYELSGDGQLLSIYDTGSLSLQDPRSLVFAPSADRTDDPANMNLFLLSSGAVESSEQIVEVSLLAPAALPSGTPLLPATLVRTVDTSKNAWSPSSPDPSGIDYWPQAGRFLISDSEVEEMSPYWAGANIFGATPSGALISTCNTMSFSSEPSGLAINPITNRIYISDDDVKKVFEVNLGADGAYCTGDDSVTSFGVNTDFEDVAYGNNTIFIAGGTDAEVWMFNLGANGVLGGGDDGPVTHFDTASKGFRDLEGIGYNADAGTLFIISADGNDRYLGEVTPSGVLLRAYDLSFMGTLPNIRSDVTYAPSSQNPAVKNIYIVSRGVDNYTYSQENDGKWWEISLVSAPPPPTPTTPPPPPPVASATWYISSTGNFAFGETGDVPVPADYNGDGHEDVAVFRTSNRMWYISTTGNFSFGETGDLPVPGDYNGDGRDEIAVFRPSNGTWYISSLGNYTFGQTGDIPIPADYNGDGRDDIAVFRPSNGTWYISTRGNFAYGESGDTPLPADYNGDGSADIAVFRPSNGTWYISTRGNFVFGQNNDILVPGDYNGDGSADIAVFRPSNGTWYISTRGNFVYGESGDIPVPGDYNGDGMDDIAVYRP
jgi:hypothetical protein